MKEKIENNLKKGPAGLALMIILFIVFFIVGSAVGTGVGFWYGKKKGEKIASEKQESLEKDQESKTEEESEISAVPIEATEETYTVQKGDTLFTIGLKFNVPWTKIAEYNGLSETSVIKEGDVLKIPGAGTGEIKRFPIDETQMQHIQTQVDGGSQSWRLDPIAVAKQEIPPTYSISENDKFTLKSKNSAVGIAIVEVIHETKIYEIKLIQPVKKGSDGIWTCEYVKRI
ncbi:hypothetical protein ES702_03167 [subsurface metagenome]